MTGFSSLRRLLLGLATVVMCSCAAGNDATAKRLDELDGQMRRLKASSDRLEERLVGIETVLREEREDRGKQTTSIELSRPPLPVVAVESPSDQPAAPAPAANGDESRPLIVGEGTRLETRNSSDGANPTSARGTVAKPKPVQRDVKPSPARERVTP